jgi:hypothetical protein
MSFFRMFSYVCQYMNKSLCIWSKFLKMLDPPWALPPAQDIHPPCLGLGYALWAGDTSRKPLSLAALTGFNIAIAYALNSNSQRPSDQNRHW